MRQSLWRKASEKAGLRMPPLSKRHAWSRMMAACGPDAASPRRDIATALRIRTGSPGPALSRMPDAGRGWPTREGGGDQCGQGPAVVGTLGDEMAGHDPQPPRHEVRSARTDREHETRPVDQQGADAQHFDPVRDAAAIGACQSVGEPGPDLRTRSGRVDHRSGIGVASRRHGSSSPSRVRDVVNGRSRRRGPWLWPTRDQPRIRSRRRGRLSKLRTGLRIASHRRQ